MYCNIFHNTPGSPSAGMGHYGEVPGSWCIVPLSEIHADRGHVCFFLHDRCHDSGPPLRHMLPPSGLQAWGNLTLEHTHRGGLGSVPCA